MLLRASSMHFVKQHISQHRKLSKTCILHRRVRGELMSQAV